MSLKNGVHNLTTMKIGVLRDVTSCSWAHRYQSFGGAFFLHFHSGLLTQAWKEEDLRCKEGRTSTMAVGG